MLPQFDIQPVAQEICSQIQLKIDLKTKPQGALGKLETLALRIGLIQQTSQPTLQNPHIVIFASDHGIANAGVSAYPQEVTYQMVLNFLNGGAAINVFSRQHQIALRVVDAGVNYDFQLHEALIEAKIAKSTKNFAIEPAMMEAEAIAALQKGAEIVAEIQKNGCNVIGFGEMGIANTSSAAVLMTLLGKCLLEDCVGRGTGLTDDKLAQKEEILRSAILHHNLQNFSTLDVLKTFGGFEIVMMAGAMLKAAELKMIVLVDGFIASAAFLVASKFNELVKEYAFFCHQSDEKGHAKLLEILDVEPLLRLSMRLGEGTGCAVAYPLLQSAVLFLNEMASFTTAGVSEKA
jgi:nicotinate-nucleotide--dimethylbenzimidazole phosphoribosyltransferase